MSGAYLLAPQRTPIGKFLGGLAGFTAPQLAAISLRATLTAAGIEPQQVYEVILGEVVTAGVGQAPARQAALLGGLPDSVAALTINKVCGSGLKAVMLADQIIRSGDARVIVAGGMESMSQAPHLLPGSRVGWKYGPQTMVDSLVNDGLWCASEKTAMGELAEWTAAKCGLTRERQDALAAESHRRAIAARDAGKFTAEIVPVTVTGKTPVTISADEGPRAETSAAKLAALRPAFMTGVTVTAGNSSQLSDGAATVLVVDQETARASSAPLKAQIVATATSGGPPRELFLAPIAAVEKVLAKAGWTRESVDLFELNEAFAAQALACIDGLQLSTDKVNVNGGAIALGHPIGASGARVLVTLLHALADRGGTRGIAALCLGGGNAVAVAVERVS